MDPYSMSYYVFDEKQDKISFCLNSQKTEAA